MDNKQDKGFTLVELLIVIVILGILATVTVLAVSGITNTAKENTCESDGATLQVAYESAYVQNDAAIPTLGDLTDALSDNNSAKVAASPGAGTWGYVATATGGTLTPPTDAPSTCAAITLS
jgi:prepilin-type N-terminal cleavage/methylation domain-containing protein